MGIVQQRQRRAHPAVHFRPPTHPAKFDADVVTQRSYIRCGCICRRRHSMVARRPGLEARASGTISGLAGSNARMATTRAGRSRLRAPPPLVVSSSSFLSSFLHLFFCIRIDNGQSVYQPGGWAWAYASSSQTTVAGRQLDLPTGYGLRGSPHTNGQRDPPDYVIA